MTNAEVKAKLDELKLTFAAGKFWNHSPSAENDPASVTNSACTHHDDCNYDGSCGCNSFDGAIQCHGFAKYMAYRVFGHYPSVSGSYSTQYNGRDMGNGWKLYTSNYLSELSLEPGDLIRTSTHTAIVYSVNNGNVTVGEVWGNPSNASNNCKIAWGRFNGTSSDSHSTESYIKSIAAYIVKAPKDSGGDTPSPIGNTYRISNVGASTTSSRKCLNIHGSNLTSLYNGINVTLWSEDTSSNEQKWEISELGTGVHIKSVIDTAYGLNIYRSGSPYNCNIYKIAGNETDATFDITAADSNGYRKVKWTSSDGTKVRYLTVGASTDGTNVYWDEASTSSYQKWLFEKL